MLEKNEYEIIHHNGMKYIICQRLDMVPDIERELMQGTVFGYKCTPEKQSIVRWLKLFGDLTKITFNIGSSRAGYAHVVSKARARCHHMVPDRTDRPRKRQCKRNSGCETRLVLTAIKCTKRSRSRLPTRGCSLRVTCNGKPHNHPTNTAEALKYRNVSDASKALLLELFDRHHSPSSALDMLKLRLLEEHGDNYPSVAADRHFLPDLPYATRLYYRTYRARYGKCPRGEVRRLRDSAEEVAAESLEAVRAGVIEMTYNTQHANYDIIDVLQAPGELAADPFDSERHSQVEPAGPVPTGDPPVHGSPTEMDCAATDNSFELVSERDRRPAAAADAGAARRAAECFRQWAARVSDQIAADASGRSGRAAADLMRQWERLVGSGPPPEPAGHRRVTVMAIPGQTVTVGGTLCEAVPVRPRGRTLCVLRADEPPDEDSASVHEDG